MASECKAEIFVSIATYVGEGEIVCRRGEGLHHIIQIGEEICRLLQLSQLHGSRALDHGHEYARSYSVSRDVGYIGVPAPVAPDNVKEVATHLATGN